MPQEKRWGPDYLKFDLGVYGSAGGDLGFVIYGKHTRTWLNALGAEWRNEVQLGYENALETSLYQPLDVAQRFFVEPRANLSLTREDMFTDGERVATYNFGDIGGAIDVGVNFGRRAQARVGYLYTHRTVDVDTGSRFLPEGDFNDAGIGAALTYDSRDTAFNPTKGMAGMIEYMHSDESLGADRDWERIEAGFGMAVPVRKDVVWATLAGGTDLGSTLPPDRLFMLGGPGSFPGYELGELRASAYWSAARQLPLEAHRHHVAARPGAVCGRAAAGRADLRSHRPRRRRRGLRRVGLHRGSHAGGPLTVGFGTTSSDAWSLWLSVGRPIGHGTILERGVFR